VEIPVKRRADADHIRRRGAISPSVLNATPVSLPGFIASAGGAYEADVLVLFIDERPRLTLWTDDEKTAPKRVDGFPEIAKSGGHIFSGQRLRRIAVPVNTPPGVGCAGSVIAAWDEDLPGGWFLLAVGSL
jgi:hypothetical protein